MANEAKDDNTKFQDGIYRLNGTETLYYNYKPARSDTKSFPISLLFYNGYISPVWSQKDRDDGFFQFHKTKTCGQYESNNFFHWTVGRIKYSGIIDKSTMELKGCISDVVHYTPGGNTQFNYKMELQAAVKNAGNDDSVKIETIQKEYQVKFIFIYFRSV